MSSEKLTKVYVYGTLRPGDTDTVLVPGKLYTLGGFPGISLEVDSDDDTVVCEIIEVDDNRLASLDRYEGYRENDPEGSLYLRQEYKDGFIYVYNHLYRVSEEQRIPSGDWLDFKNELRGRASKYFTEEAA